MLGLELVLRLGLGFDSRVRVSVRASTVVDLLVIFNELHKNSYFANRWV